MHASDLPQTGHANTQAANRLWFYRKQLGYSQKKVAFLLGHRSASRVSNYERGHRVPALATAMKLALILQTPISRLYPDLHAQLKAHIERREKRWKAGQAKGDGRSADGRQAGGGQGQADPSAALPTD